jgi:hypothetical protein
MILYQLSVPACDNQGRPMVSGHKQFRDALLSDFGGFTELRGDGAWRDGSRDYCEPVIIYQVATTRPVFAFPPLLRRCFPDQKAFFIATIGNAQVTA